MSNNSFKVKNGLTLTPVDLATLLNPQAGDLACDINDSNKIKRYDAATSAWAEVGSGGVGSLDILFAQDFESASLSSFTQTGLALDTVDPLHGKVSAKLTHDASINQSFKEVKAVDRKFRGQAIVMRLNVKSAASAGNVTVSVYDETNAASLLSSTQLNLSNDVDGISNAVSFTIPSTSSSISYTITALPEAGSPVTFIDDIVAELSNVALLETSVEVPVMTAWQGYTPTFQGFGTPTNIEFEWRQVGENVEIRGKFTAGTTTAVEARVGLPGGLTSSGTSLIPSIQKVGSGARSNLDGFSLGILVEPNVTYTTFSLESTTRNGISKTNGNTLLVSGDSISFFASVPCAGLSATSDKTIPLTQSGLVQEADSYITLSGASGYGTSATTIRRFSTVTSSGGTDIQYEDSPTLGGRFIAQESGIYHVTYSEENTASVVQASSILYVNGVKVSVNQSDYGGATSATKRNSVSWSGYLEQGDIVTAGANVAAENNGTFVYFSMVKQGSLKQVSVSSDQKITIPTSELRFEGASARGSTDTGIVQFTSMSKLRGDAFTVESDAVLGTRITMKKAGKLAVSVSMLVNAAGSVFGISLNQSVRTSSPTLPSEILSNQQIATSGGNESTSWQGEVQAGDIIRIYSTLVPTAAISNNLNLSFQEQDISVSVTNTLPQFSDSDSSVRVDTANGYGSTATKIRRFSNVRDNIGADIEYLDSATDGSSFTVKSSGIYNISYSDSGNAAGQIGITLNSTNLTTNISTLAGNANNEVLAIQDRAQTTSTNYAANASWQGYLSAGDIIRPHSDGLAPSNVNVVKFTISKVGKPNVTGVDVTPFVNVPLSKASRVIVKSFESGTSWYEIYNDGWVRQGSTIASHLITNVAQTGTFVFQLRDMSSLYSFNMIAKATGLGGAQQNLSISSWTTTTFTYYTNDGQTGPLIWTAEGYGSTSDINALGITISNSTTSDYILTAPETFSTDTASLTYASSSAYTLSTLQNAPIGTFITFTYAANTNTRTQTTTAPTQTTADMNVNGIQLFTRAYNAASTAASPAAIAIQIGKGLKGRSLDLYKSAGKVTAGSLDFLLATNVAPFDTMGIFQKEYNEVTGILIIDAGITLVNSNLRRLLFTDNTETTSGYLVINASKSPALTGVPLVQPRIATLSDVKASGTAGGTATSGSYQTRTLNTLSDPSGIVTSLASNQFVLPAGEYYIEAEAPAVAVGQQVIGQHKAKLRNITDGTDSIIGTAAASQGNPTSSVISYSTSNIKGNLVISSSKTFEIQHRVTVTRAGDGFGTPSSFGDNEVYTVVKITKVK